MAKAKGRSGSGGRKAAPRKEPDLGALDGFTKKILKVPKEELDKNLERERKGKDKD